MRRLARDETTTAALENDVLVPLSLLELCDKYNETAAIPPPARIRDSFFVTYCKPLDADIFRSWMQTAAAPEPDEFERMDWWGWLFDKFVLQPEMERDRGEIGGLREVFRYGKSAIQELHERLRPFLFALLEIGWIESEQALMVAVRETFQTYIGDVLPPIPLPASEASDDVPAVAGPGANDVHDERSRGAAAAEQKDIVNDVDASSAGLPGPIVDDVASRAEPSKHGAEQTRGEQRVATAQQQRQTTAPRNHPPAGSTLSTSGGRGCARTLPCGACSERARGAACDGMRLTTGSFAWTLRSPFSTPPRESATPCAVYGQ